MVRRGCASVTTLLSPAAPTLPRWVDGSTNERADGGVDEVSLPRGPGRLWLCGKHHVAPDPEAALARLGASTIVCLTEPHELRERYPAYVDWLRSSTPERALWHPVPDLHAALAR